MQVSPGDKNIRRAALFLKRQLSGLCVQGWHTTLKGIHELRLLSRTQKTCQRTCWHHSEQIADTNQSHENSTTWRPKQNILARLAAVRSALQTIKGPHCQNSTAPQNVLSVRLVRWLQQLYCVHARCSQLAHRLPSVNEMTQPMWATGAQMGKPLAQ